MHGSLAIDARVGCHGDEPGHGDVGLHTFRHDFISSLANDPKVALSALQLIVGHVRLETTAVYVHKDPEAMRVAMLRRAESVS